MMIHAYPETLLAKAQSSLGDAFDYAVNTCGIPGVTFAMMLAGGSTGKRLERGDVACLAGMSGIELARKVVEEGTGIAPLVEPQERMGRSAEYWIGWAVAYYQWSSGRTYAQIFRAVPLKDLVALYPTLHEADVTKFADVMDARMAEAFPETNLKRIRNAYGVSQVELARRSGTGLRSIQMYEQRNKDINKASASTLRAIARVLGCTIEDLMEP